MTHATPVSTDNDGFLADVVERGMAYATRLVDFDVARDITHELAIEIWQRRQREPEFLDDTSERERFVRTAIRHDVIDLARARKRADVRNATHAREVDNAMREWMEPEAVEDARELERVIGRVLEDMAPRRRSVFLRVRDDGLSYEAVARETGLSVKTVQAHVVRAQAQLRVALARYREEGK
jgi:RNA polymerase sigma factor (sigma-70 family)